MNATLRFDQKGLRPHHTGEKEMQTKTIHKHGSPYDRGSADAYYGRLSNPHYWPEGTYMGEKVSHEDMTAEQIEEYYDGYDNETDRKEW